MVVPRASMMRQTARYSSSEGWSRERLERLRFAHGIVGSSKGKEGAVAVGELRAWRAIWVCGEGEKLKTLKM